MADMADEVFSDLITEHAQPAHRLGRHIEHDQRSRAFPAARAPKVVSVAHTRHCPPFDQGETGSCTGNAEAGVLMTDPTFVTGRSLTEADAVVLYEKATHLDRITGSYPPDDTGSSGLAVMKAAKALGYITGYRHAFGLQHALEALVLAPVITGVSWYEGFDSPNSDGTVKISGSVRGGHEFEVVAIDADAHTVRACNSWGTGWGDHGYFQFSWDTWDQLLEERGDVTVVTAA
jgi:hypothetical protein